MLNTQVVSKIINNIVGVFFLEFNYHTSPLPPGATATNQRAGDQHYCQGRATDENRAKHTHVVTQHSGECL